LDFGEGAILDNGIFSRDPVHVEKTLIGLMETIEGLIFAVTRWFTGSYVILVVDSVGNKRRRTMCKPCLLENKFTTRISLSILVSLSSIFLSTTGIQVVSLMIIPDIVGESFATFSILPLACLVHLIFNKADEAGPLVPYTPFSKILTDLDQSNFNIGVLLDDCLSICGRICCGGFKKILES
jgi:hypothetical protein